VRFLLFLCLLSLAGCAADSTAPEPPLPPSSVWTREIDASRRPDFTDLAAVGPDDALAVGKAGLAVRWDGTAWRAVPPDPPADLEDVFVLADGTYLVAANAPRFYALGEGGWESRPVTGALGGHTAIWGSSLDDVYLAGSQGRLLHVTPDGTRVMAGDEGPLPDITHVWGSAPDDVWAVGPSGLFRFDGVAWTEVVLGISVGFAAMEGRPSGEFFMITYGSLLYTWNGENWWVDQLNIPGLWGGWMTGARSIRFFSRDGGVSSWTEGEFTPGEGVEPGPLFCRGAAPLGDGSAFLVERRGQVLRFDGNSTAPHSLAVAPDDTYGAAWAISPDDFVLASASGGFLHRTDGVWSVQAAGGFQAGALWGASADDLFAVGSGIHHWEGEAWTEVEEAPPAFYQSIHGAEGIVVAGGTQGRVARRVEGNWIPDQLDTSRSLTSVWTDGPGNVWVGDGACEFLARFDGTTWTPLPAAEALTGDLLALWGAADGSDGWLVTSDQSVHRLRNGAWTPVRPAGTSQLVAAVPLGPDEALFVRDAGTVERLAEGEVEPWAATPEGSGTPGAFAPWGPRGFLLADGVGSCWSFAPAR